MTETPRRVLPARPDFTQLRTQAKELRATGVYPSLAAAQHALATEYGFAGWAKLKIVVEQTTLRRLIEEGDVAGVRALVAASPSLVRLPFDNGNTPMHLAAGENRPEIISVLAAAGAPLDARYGRWAHSALSWALTCWSFPAAEKLVELGVTPDLFCAAGLGHLERVQSFWQDGRLKRRPSRTGSSRYDEAGELLPAPPPRDRDQVSDALYIACRANRLAVARWLLDHGADPNWRGYAGATCLAWAEFSGNPELCPLLRERGGSDDATDTEFGATPKAFAIMVMAGWGFPRELAARLTADSSLVAHTCVRGTPLHVAAAAGNVLTVKILLHFGADRNAKDPQGRTPAEVGAAHPEVVLLLVDKPESI